jgi:hypothetical protein
VRLALLANARAPLVEYSKAGTTRRNNYKCRTIGLLKKILG